MGIYVTHSSNYGNNYWTFWLDKNRVGKCVTTNKNRVTNLIYIEILKDYRGNDYSTRFWKLVEQELDTNKITLETAERDWGYNKLVNLYSRWGFQISGKERYAYHGDYLIRKIPMVKYCK